MKKIQVNSPEYQKIVNNLLGKEIKFEDVPQIPQEKTTVTVPKKVAKKKVVEKKKEKIYLLFQTSEFGNSDDYAYELDYAFKGAYHSKEAALKAAVSMIMEQEDEDLESEFFDTETNELLGNVKDSLLERGWKILDTNVE